MSFNREVIPISDLPNGVAYRTFLNVLLLRRFIFSLAESKVMKLAKALRRAHDFLQAAEDKRPRKDEERVRYFHTSPQIFLWRSKAITNKCGKYHKNFRNTTYECRELKKALHELAILGQLNHFLRRGRGVDRNRHDPVGKKHNGDDCNTEIITTIIRGVVDKELNDGHRKS
ncbi:hypothetical protein Cgig2_021758 [Carnegiea gigantea]|uniref:Uncharacterized protein n=1 Tax=Carnegiea gigantea TaxID=171969 RepID=A0A9Q1JRW7_9CARY|nr:hypothetical protein Cgig2_021758 [Carnegiea gigantea]